VCCEHLRIENIGSQTPTRSLWFTLSHLLSTTVPDSAACYSRCSIRPTQEIGRRPLTRRRENSSLFCRDFSGWCNLGKIINIVATRCHLLKLKCTKFDFGWGSVQDPAGGATALRRSHPLARFKGPTSKGKEGRRRKDRKGGKIKG